MAERAVEMQVKLAAVLARAVGESERVNVSALCAELGISRTSFYKYKARFAAEGVAGLLARSRRPHRSPDQLPAVMEEQIVRLRKELAEAGWDNGAVSIRYRMAGQGLDPPAASTIHRVLRRRGLVVDQPRKGRGQPTDDLSTPLRTTAGKSMRFAGSLPTAPMW